MADPQLMSQLVDVISPNMRTLLIIYGTHAATTLIPVLCYLYFHPKLTDIQRFLLIVIYVPYFVIPSWIALYFGFGFGSGCNVQKSRASREADPGNVLNIQSRKGQRAQKTD
jgi:hypothetical protein